MRDYLCKPQKGLGVIFFHHNSGSSVLVNFVKYMKYVYVSYIFNTKVVRIYFYYSTLVALGFVCFIVSKNHFHVTRQIINAIVVKQRCCVFTCIVNNISALIVNRLENVRLHKFNKINLKLNNKNHNKNSEYNANVETLLY
jgi:hypothetical protein